MKTERENVKTDVVIIGGGGAGLAAAISAAQNGAKNVTVIEKTGAPGGNAAISHGIFAVNSKAQERLGIKLSADDIFRDKMAYSNWNINARLVRTAIDQSAKMIEWLEEKGMKFDYIVGFVPAGEGPRVFHKVGPSPMEGAVGEPLVKVLTEECRKLGVRITVNTTASRILRDQKGKLTGVLCNKEGRETAISTESIVIATGGFGGNKDMLNKYFPYHADIFCNSLPQMTGDGINMAAEAGAFIESQITILIIGPHHYPWSRSLGILVRRPDVLLVNKFGRRYVDESMGFHFMDKASNALSRQPDKTCYALIDSRIKQELERGERPIGGIEDDLGEKGAWRKELEQDFIKEKKEGYAGVADSWKEIAEYTGAEARTLEATIEQYNHYCDRGYDPDFLKDRSYLLPLRQPPFYAIMGRQGFDTTLGGIRIDEKMQVLDKNNCPMPGLYAAGDNASGYESVNYNHRYPGSALSFALVSGWNAGINAAGYASRVKAK